MEISSRDILVILVFVLPMIVGAFAYRKIDDSRRERDNYANKYSRMANINHERTDDLNALNAKLLRKDEQIARLEDELSLKSLMVLHLSKTLESIADVPDSPHPLPDCVRAKHWGDDAEKWARKTLMERKKNAQES